MKQQKTIRAITLKIAPELWRKFKEHVPRAKTLNDAIVELIQKEVSAQ